MSHGKGGAFCKFAHKIKVVRLCIILMKITKVISILNVIDISVCKNKQFVEHSVTSIPKYYCERYFDSSF